MSEVYSLEKVDLLKLCSNAKRISEVNAESSLQLATVKDNTAVLGNKSAKQRHDEVMLIARKRDPKYFVEVNRIVNDVINKMGIR